MIMIGETLGILPTGALVGMVIAGKIELLSVAAPNREYDLVDNQLFMIVHQKGIKHWALGIEHWALVILLVPLSPHSFAHHFIEKWID
ncbi:hypothetical protein [Nostoc sp.]|uniref:hypothetical protein n=1 Tax=Nostoc sp. TaxID=1180 RepID=UPI002FFC5A9F